jgi:hypothetical protein
MNPTMLAGTTAAMTARQEVYHSAPQRVLLVALDLGKDVHVVMMRTLAEQVCSALCARRSRAGACVASRFMPPRRRRPARWPRRRAVFAGR